jgi:hypothetical protein
MEKQELLKKLELIKSKIFERRMTECIRTLNLIINDIKQELEKENQNAKGN